MFRGDTDIQTVALILSTACRGHWVTGELGVGLGFWPEQNCPGGPDALGSLGL